MVCMVVGIILIPLCAEILYRIANFRLPFPVILLVEVIAMIGIVAIHSWAILKENVSKSVDGPSVIDELRDQLNDLKAE